MLTLRRAQADDSEIVWLWRNDAATRAASLNDQPIPFEHHDRWFAAVLSHPDHELMIGIDEAGNRVGMVRFDVDSPTSATVSINVAPQFRGAGIGRAMLRAALEYMATEHPGVTLTAVIRASNAASLQIFGREGFVKKSRSSDLVTLTATLGGRVH